MPKFKDDGAPARQITPFAPLNALLATFTGGLQSVLGDNFVGAYLQGSFALGDADENSDVDFLVAVRRDLTEADLPALHELHAAIHDLPTPWSYRLDGSYMPLPILRRWSESPRDPPGEPPRSADWADPGTGGSPPRVYPFWYLDHGSRILTRSEHCNTQVVRWTARERGVVLAGPDPKTLIDPVDPEALKAEMRQTMRACAERHVHPDKVTLRAWQAFYVVLFCRMLMGLETGELTSKKIAADWATRTLDPRWRPLIDRAWKVRFEPYAVSMGPPDPEDLAETIAFVAYALARDSQASASAQAERARAALALKRALRTPVDGGNSSGWDGRPSRGPKPRNWTPPPVRPGGRGRRG